MTLLTARALGPVRSRLDWPQERLVYFRPAAYDRLIRFAHFLGRR